ncbi:type IV pilin N-terminal domain-containing protein [Methanolacinia paynteri]|uniref:type IV pilin N-terminal domain-containing protein n=1 Tax=Methanolacinia paynteri TaxID=230356 RepID=UPI00064E2391|nr:type IV pilin N-terminal domain-containing protein [Methanolacinia paynteri]
MVNTNTKKEAVSPVVGVMLMLVVTIIIAAVVSGFGTGMIGDAPTATPASVRYVGISPGGSDMVLDDGFVGLIFEVTGGSLDLEKLKFYIYGSDFGGGGEAYMTYNDVPWSKYYVGGEGASGGLRFYYNNPGTGTLAYEPAEFYTSRMMKFTSLDYTGEGMCPGDTILTTGDRFILFFEYFKPQTATGPPTLGFGMHRNTGSGASTAFQSGAVYANGDGQGILSGIDGTVYWDGYLKASDII